MDGISEISKRREDACKSLEKSLQHFPLVKIIYLITSFMSIEELEKLAKFQK